GTAHLLLEVSLPQRFCPYAPRIPGRKGISRQLSRIRPASFPKRQGHSTIRRFHGPHAQKVSPLTAMQSLLVCVNEARPPGVTEATPRGELAPRVKEFQLG